MNTLHSLVDLAIDDLEEALTDNETLGHSSTLSDKVHEIADGIIPVYTSDLLEVARDELRLATQEAELGPAFDGRSTPINIIASNIYVHLTEKLRERIHENKKELLD